MPQARGSVRPADECRRRLADCRIGAHPLVEADRVRVGVDLGCGRPRLRRSRAYLEPHARTGDGPASRPDGADGSTHRSSSSAAVAPGCTWLVAVADRAGLRRCPQPPDPRGRADLVGATGAVIASLHPLQRSRRRSPSAPSSGAARALSASRFVGRGLGGCAAQASVARRRSSLGGRSPGIGSSPPAGRRPPPAARRPRPRRRAASRSPWRRSRSPPRRAAARRSERRKRSTTSIGARRSAGTDRRSG